MDNNGIPEPEWYLELKSKTPPGEQPTYEKLTLAEFCGRFDLAENTALWEIKRCKLWGCGKPLLILRSKSPQSEAPYTIPEKEADRFAEIIAAENIVAVSPPTTLPKEKPADYAARRREEGASDGQIAKELRAMGCYFSTIGRTLQPLPACGDSAFQKRGKKLVTS